MNLSESTKQQIIEEFQLPSDIFKEMYIDEYVAQQKENEFGGLGIEKTIVLKHNSAKIPFEQFTTESNEESYNEDIDDDDSESWKN